MAGVLKPALNSVPGSSSGKRIERFFLLNVPLELIEPLAKLSDLSTPASMLNLLYSNATSVYIVCLFKSAFVAATEGLVTS